MVIIYNRITAFQLKLTPLFSIGKFHIKWLSHDDTTYLQYPVDPTQ